MIELKKNKTDKKNIPVSKDIHKRLKKHIAGIEDTNIKTFTEDAILEKIKLSHKN